MSIRHLVAVALMATAGAAAHADVISTTSSGSSAAQSSFLSGWTTGNGSNVLSSGVLSSNLSLLGGIAYSSGSAAKGGSLADALFGKASTSLGVTADGNTKVFYTRGIEGTYLLGSGHGIMAAMLGDGVSVTGANDGLVISQGVSAIGSAAAVMPMPAAISPLAVGEVPEPTSIALMLAGVMGFGALRRRKQQA